MKYICPMHRQCNDTYCAHHREHALTSKCDDSVCNRTRTGIGDQRYGCTCVKVDSMYSEFLIRDFIEEKEMTL